ncbi:hypothetical protein SDC9_55040 [bioreactor metagenome]|uniref:Uncharacterized protein n=1 Tax=bioreactor metagenome TaxID=1076179 RepID=A0A644WXU8_9ZZZZ
MQTGSLDIIIVDSMRPWLKGYRNTLIAHLNEIRLRLKTMSADDDRFHDLSAERDEILKQLNPNNK